MEKTALVALNLVAEAALQRFARVIQTLLRVAEPIHQLAPERTRATIDAPLKIDNIGDNQFRGGAGGGRAQISDEIADGKIDFVTHRRDNGHGGMEYCACDNLFVELP